MNTTLLSKVVAGFLLVAALGAGCGGGGGGGGGGSAPPARTEAEPNDGALAATPVAIGQPALGEIIELASGGVDTDFWSFEGREGDLFTADLRAIRTDLFGWAEVDGERKTPRLILRAPDGTTIIAHASGDAAGADTFADPRLLNVRLPATGRYTLEVTADLGGDSARYHFVPAIARPEITGEVEPNGTPAGATPLGSAAFAHGNLDAGADPADTFSLEVAASADRPTLLVVEAFAARNESDPRLEPLPLDTTLRLRDASGAELAVAIGDVTRDPVLTFAIEAAGTYFVELTAVEGAGPYVLAFRKEQLSPARESEPNATTADADPAPLPGSFAGALAGTDEDRVVYDAAARHVIELLLLTPPDGLAGSGSPRITMDLDPDGGDHGSVGTANGAGRFARAIVPPAGGDVVVQIAGSPEPYILIARRIATTPEAAGDLETRLGIGRTGTGTLEDDQDVDTWAIAVEKGRAYLVTIESGNADAPLGGNGEEAIVTSRFLDPVVTGRGTGSPSLFGEIARRDFQGELVIPLATAEPRHGVQAAFVADRDGTVLIDVSSRGGALSPDADENQYTITVTRD